MKKKNLFKQECHRSLDTGDDHLTRPTSTTSKIFDARDAGMMEHTTNLIKGKSMPSLRSVRLSNPNAIPKSSFILLYIYIYLLNIF